MISMNWFLGYCLNVGLWDQPFKFKDVYLDYYTLPTTAQSKETLVAESDDQTREANSSLSICFDVNKENFHSKNPWPNYAVREHIIN